MKKMKTFKYFTLEEFIHSDTAQRNKIDNTPSEEVVEHLEEVMEFLDGFREFYGSPIKVSSGYRCPKLNKLVKGVSNSAHLTGYAADIQPGNFKFDDFCRKITEYVKINNKDFDQIIIEKSKTSRWIHVSVDPRNRKQIFKLNV